MHYFLEQSVILNIWNTPYTYISLGPFWFVVAATNDWSWWTGNFEKRGNCHYYIAAYY